MTRAALPISIVIPAFNQLNYVRQCVASIAENTDRPYRLVLVDNGSTDGVGDYFDAVLGATVVHTGENLGFAGGVNAGLRQVEDGHVVVLNSDTLVPREWLGRLEAALLARDDLGAAGPMSNYVSGPQLIPDLELHSMDAINAVSRRLHAEHGTATDDTARLVGFCMMVRDEAFRQVGLFDEAFGVGNCEDDDYCLRIMKAGWKLGVARGCFVFHYGHRTFTGMGLEGESFNALVRQNLDHLTTKWGFETALQSPQGAQAAELNGQGRAALERGDVDAAVDLLKRAVEACPVIATHHNDLGAALWKAGRQDMAFRCFANALRIQPDEPDARANLHDAAAAMDREEEAANVLREADARLKEAP